MSGTCVQSDEQRLVDFVVWEFRAGDLPHDVREAAHRIAAGAKRPAHLAGAPIRYTEGPLTIDGMKNDDDSFDRRKAYPHQVGSVIRDLLSRGCQYILVQDL